MPESNKFHELARIIRDTRSWGTAEDALIQDVCDALAQRFMARWPITAATRLAIIKPKHTPVLDYYVPGYDMARVTVGVPQQVREDGWLVVVAGYGLEPVLIIWSEGK